MKSRFESAEWLAAIARLVQSSDVDSAAGALAEAIGVAVEHEGTCLLAFHRDAPPEVFHHTEDGLVKILLQVKDLSNQRVPLPDERIIYCRIFFLRRKVFGVQRS